MFYRGKCPAKCPSHFFFFFFCHGYLFQLKTDSSMPAREIYHISQYRSKADIIKKLKNTVMWTTRNSISLSQKSSGWWFQYGMVVWWPRILLFCHPQHVTSPSEPKSLPYEYILVGGKRRKKERICLFLRNSPKFEHDFPAHILLART